MSTEIKAIRVDLVGADRPRLKFARLAKAAVLWAVSTMIYVVVVHAA